MVELVEARILWSGGLNRLGRPMPALFSVMATAVTRTVVSRSGAAAISATATASASRRGYVTGSAAIGVSGTASLASTIMAAGAAAVSVAATGIARRQGSCLGAGVIGLLASASAFVIVRVTAMAAISIDAPDTLPQNSPTDILLSGNSISENSSIGTVIGSFFTTDPDDHAQDQFSYALSDDAGGLFAINEDDELELASALDYETAQSHDITVLVQDPAELQFSKTFTIEVLDFNEEQAPAAPANVTPPSIAGTPQQDRALVVNPGTWTGNAPPGFLYQWKKNGGISISGAVERIYVPRAADVGAFLTVEVIGRNAVSDVPVTTAAVGPITASAFVTSRFVAPTAAGTGTGQGGFHNASSFAFFVAMIAEAGSDGIVYLRADAGSYTAALKTIQAGGSSGHPCTIRGVTAQLVPAYATINGSRANPWVLGGATGPEVFRLMGGADYLSFEFLKFTNCGNGCFRPGAPISGLNIESIQAVNVQRLVENTVSGAETDASISGFTARNIDVRGFAKAVIRIQYDTNNILVEDAYLDCAGQDDNFPVGVLLDDTCHNGIIRRVTTVRCVRDNGSGYWQGDGFTQEGGVFGITYEDTVAKHCADGGYDLKGDCILIRALSVDNKYNYRFWGNATLQECVGLDPYKRGGTGDQAQLWVREGAVVTATDCAFADDDPLTTAVYMIEDAGGVGATLTTVNTSVQKNAAAALVINTNDGVVTLDTEMPPENTVLPVLTGQGIVGHTLSSSIGAFTGTDLSFTFQWKRNNRFIFDAAAQTYVVQNADDGFALTCTVYAQDENGFVGEATTAPTATVAGIPPFNTVLPSISGLPVIGAPLTGTHGTWTGSPQPTFLPQWYRGTTPISGADTLAYAPESADEGTLLKLRITASNVNGTVFAESAAIGPVTQPQVSTFYIAPTALGDGSGTSIANAAGGLGNLNALIGASLGGSTIVVLADLGTYTVLAQIDITTHGGATAGSKITIEGRDSNGSVAKPTIESDRTPWTLPVDPEQTTDVRSWTIGSRIFNFATGVDNLICKDFNFERCGDGVFYFTGANDGLEFANIQFYNVKRLFETTSAVTLTNLTVDGVTGVGFSENVMRFGGDSNNITIRDVDADSGRQDGDNFAMGIICDGTVHAVEIYRANIRNCHDGVLNYSTDYWNGDGFTSNGGVYDMYLEDCSASGHTDAGGDFKHSITPAWRVTHPYDFVRCNFSGNKKNLKMWADYLAKDCVLADPVKRGGSSNWDNIEFASSSTPSSLVMDGGTITGSGQIVAGSFNIESIATLNGVDIDGVPSSWIAGTGAIVLNDCTGDVMDVHGDSTTATYIATDAGAVVAGPVVLDWPANEKGDVAVVTVFSDTDASITFPAGWTVEAQVNVSTVFGARQAWRRLEGQFFGQLAITAGSGGIVRTGVIHIFDGCAPTGTPYEGYAVTSGTGAAMTSPTTVVSGASRRVNRQFVISSNATQGSTPAGYTLLHTHTTSFGDNAGDLLDSKAGVGAGTEAATSRTSTASSSTPWVVFGYALRPDTAVGGVAPTIQTAPAVTGSAVQGATLTCSSGTWNGTPSPTFTRRWIRGASTVISGATASTYVLQAADVGFTVKCEVTADNDVEPNGIATSAATGTVTASSAAPVNTTAPAVTGTAQVGQQLSCSTGTWTASPSPTFTYQWQRGSTNISGATGSTRTLVTGDVGFTIRCVVTANNGVSPNGTANSNSTSAVTTAPSGTNTYFANNATTFAVPDIQKPAGYYVSGMNATWCYWDGTQARAPFVRVLDHDTGLWGSTYQIASTGMVNDDHGGPVGCRDHQGRHHCFWGGHGGQYRQRHASTNAADDPSSWTERAAMHPTNADSVTYPEPIVANNKIYVFHRDSNLSKEMRLTVTIGTPSNGVVTWGSLIPLATGGTANQGTRYYKGITFVDGQDVYITATISDYNNTSASRVGTYATVYNMLTGVQRNVQNTVTFAAGHLITRSELDTYCRPAISVGSVYTMGKDAAGKIWIFYEDSGVGYAKSLAPGATSWSAAINSDLPRRVHNLSDGRIQYLSQSGSNIFFRTFSAGGVWSSGSTIFTRERTTATSSGYTGELRWDATPVSFGHESRAVVIAGERSNIGGLTSSSTHPNAGDENNTLRVYLFNASGVIRAPTG